MMNNSKELRRPRYASYNRRRRMVLNVDLNDTPPGEASSTTTTQHGGAQTSEQGRGGGLLPPPPLPATIDLEAIDDEVVICSPRSFAEARSKARRNQEVTVLLEDPQVQRANIAEATTRLTLSSYNMRKRARVITIDPTEERDTKKRNAKKPPEQLQSVPPPKEPTFSCPICLAPLKEEVSTKCGHIFCKKCIMDAIKITSKCPTCRRKLTMKDTIRVYLPATN